MYKTLSTGVPKLAVLAGCQVDCETIARGSSFWSTLPVRIGMHPKLEKAYISTAFVYSSLIPKSAICVTLNNSFNRFVMLCHLQRNQTLHLSLQTYFWLSLNCLLQLRLYSNSFPNLDGNEWQSCVMRATRNSVKYENHFGLCFK